MAFMVKKKAEKVKLKIRWWKLKETSCQEVFRQKMTRTLGGKDGLPDDDTGQNSGNAKKNN